MKFLQVIAALLLLSTTLDASSFRTFTDRDGNQMYAQLIALEGLIVHVRREDGRAFQIPLGKFSERDRNYIRSWHRGSPIEDSYVNTSISSSYDSYDRNYGSGQSVSVDSNIRAAFSTREDEPDIPGLNKNWEYRIIEPRVTLENRDSGTHYSNVYVTLVLVAESVRDNNLKKVLAIEELTVDLPYGKKVQPEIDPVKLSYREDGNYSAGFTFDGYILIVRNNRGGIAHFSSSSGLWKDKSIVDNLMEDSYYDESLTNEIVVERGFASF